MATDTRQQPPDFALSVREIAAMLEDRIETLVSELLPVAVREGHEMCVGSLAGDRGQSLRINIGRGHKRGWWKDFSSGEGGDALGLVAAVLFAGNVKDAVRWAKSWLGLDDADPARLQQRRREADARAQERAAAADRERKQGQKRARARWLQASPIAGTPAETYLRGRAIDLRMLGRAPRVLRFHPKLQYGYEGPKLPAMVAAIVNLAGKHVGTHRTWLKADGSGKADAAELGVDARGQPNDPKKVMGPYWGGHIPLWKGVHKQPLRDVPPGTDIYVSEGIEDGLTAACADPGLRIIAMVSLGNLLSIELPPQMGRLILLKQNDPPGSPAAKLFARGVAHQRAQGRHVLVVEVPDGVKDLNDLAREEAALGIRGQQTAAPGIRSQKED